MAAAQPGLAAAQHETVRKKNGNKSRNKNGNLGINLGINLGLNLGINSQGMWEWDVGMAAAQPGLAAAQHEIVRNKNGNKSRNKNGNLGKNLGLNLGLNPGLNPGMNLGINSQGMWEWDVGMECGNGAAQPGLAAAQHETVRNKNGNKNGSLVLNPGLNPGINPEINPGIGEKYGIKSRNKSGNKQPGNVGMECGNGGSTAWTHGCST